MPPIKKIVALLRAHYPTAHCALVHKNPFQLLAATILSAQCTDERVNRVTPPLFKTYPTPARLARAPLEQVETIVRSTGFFRQKARSLVLSARLMQERHGGRVPRRMEDLLKLPGVARKTANVVLGTGFGIASGVVVDTHVRRVTARLGLTVETNPVKIERDLMALLPRADWIWFSHALIQHGRRVCLARKPRCAACALNRLCPWLSVREPGHFVSI